MKKFVTVTLSYFAFDALAGESADPDRVRESLVKAIYTYVADRSSGRPGWAYPEFLRSGGDGGRSGDRPVKLGIDEGLWDSLQQIADEQGVSLPQMAEHAALYYAAEVNAGRATERILQDRDRLQGFEGTAA